MSRHQRVFDVGTYDPSHPVNPKAIVLKCKAGGSTAVNYTYVASRKSLPQRTTLQAEQHMHPGERSSG